MLLYLVLLGATGIRELRGAVADVSIWIGDGPEPAPQVKCHMEVCCVIGAQPNCVVVEIHQV